MKKVFYFLLVCNSDVGLGHFYRCLKYSKIIKKAGYESFFLIDFNKMNLELIKKNKITNFKFVNYKSLKKNYFTASNSYKILIVDIYKIRLKDLENFKSFFNKIGYIDDLGKNYKVDFVINYFIASDIYGYKSKTKLLGYKYAPILEKKINISKTNKKNFRILISFGAMDHYNLSEKIIDICNNPKFEFYLIIGPYYKNKFSLLKKYKDYNNVKIFNSPSGLDNLLRQIDLVICAGGLTVYESLQYGKKTISIILWKNQNFTKFLVKFKIFKYIIYKDNFKFLKKKILENINFFLDTKFKKKSFIEFKNIVNSSDLVDKITCND